jgi:Tol biopolymer transport system component
LVALVIGATAATWVIAVVAIVTLGGDESESAANDLIAYEVQPEGVDFVDLVASTPSGERSQLTRTGGESEVSPSWSPDHDLIAFATTLDSGVWLMRADGTERRRLPAPGGDPVEFLPSGNEVAFWQNEAVVAVHLDTGDTRVLLDGLQGPPTDLAFSPDGRYVYLANVGPLHRYDLETGRREKVPTPTGMVEDVDVSPRGDLIAFITSDEAEVFVALPDGSDARRLVGDRGVFDVAFSRDGTRLAIVHPDNRIAVVPVDGGQPTIFEAGPVAGGIDW